MGFFSTIFGKPDNSRLTSAIKEGAFLVDVRTPEEFSSGSIKAAINIPLDRIPAQQARFKGKKNIVVFCKSGSRSSQAKIILEQLGFHDILNGGSLENVKHILAK